VSVQSNELADQLIQKFEEWRARHPLLNSDSSTTIEEWWAQRVELGLVAHGDSIYAQTNYRIRYDAAGLNADSDWLAAVNTAATADLERVVRIRISVQESSGNANNNAFKLQYRHNDGGGFGAWTDMPAEASFPTPSGIVSRTAVSMSSQYVDGADCSTQLISSGTFTTTGDGKEGSATTAGNNFASSTTEWEWAIILHRLYASRGQVNDGDVFEFRMVLSTSVVFGTYTNTPSITVNLPAGLVGGTYPESPAEAGPFEDSNGNRYFLVEDHEDGALLTMMKWTPGSGVWAPIDKANGPTTNDMEGVCIRQSGDTLWILHQPDEVVLHSFRMSDHASPDTWGVKDESVATATGALEQYCSLEIRSDGTMVAVYADLVSAENAISRKVRSSGGSWGSASTLTPPGTGLFGGGTVLLSNDDVAVYYSDDSGTTISVARRLILASTDAWDSPSNVITGLSNSTADRIPFAPPVYYDDAGVDVECIVINDADAVSLDGYYFRDGVLGTPAAIYTAAAIDDNSLASRQPSVSLAVQDKIIHLMAFNVSGTLLYFTNDDEAGWTSETAPTLDALTTPVFLRSGLCGTDLVIVYDAGDVTGGSGQVWSEFVPVATAGFSEDVSITVNATLSATGVRSGTEPKVVTIASSLVEDDAKSTSDSVSVTSTATVTASDSLSYNDEASITIASTVASSDTFFLSESAAVTITASLTVTDAHSTSESGSVVIASSVEASDSLSYTESLQLSIASTIEATDVVGAQTESVEISISSTVAVTDQADGAEDLSVESTATVADVDTASFVQTTSISISSTVSADDSLGGSTEDRSIVVSSSVTATDQLGLIESSSIAATASLQTADSLAGAENINFSITASVTATDDTGTPTESLSVEVSSSIVATDQMDVQEGLLLSITSVVDVSDTQGTPVEDVTVEVTAVVSASDVLSLSESLLASIISVVAGSESHDAIDNLTVDAQATITDTSLLSGTESLSLTMTSTIVVVDGSGVVLGIFYTFKGKARSKFFEETRATYKG
jgi:hypothetical protein